MECDPAASPAVLKLACPPLSVPVPSVAPPFLKVTMPVGVPEPEHRFGQGVDSRAAVKVTVAPKAAGFFDETTETELPALLTFWVRAGDVLPAKFESPPYTAVIELVPAFSAEVMKLAEPPPNAPVPSTAVPSINVTVSPLGGAPSLDLEVTAAVKVTACP